MLVDVHIVDAFTLDGIGGNPAGIVLEADHLTREQRQIIAAKTGLSETAFVSSSDVADIRLEFFTPSRQIAHCGHATIATFALLQQRGYLEGKTSSSKETVDGIRHIILDGTKVLMEQRAPVFTRMPEPEIAEVAAAAGLDLENVKAMTIGNTGNGFLLLELHDVSALQDMIPFEEHVRTISERHGIIGFYPFVTMPSGDVAAMARMFAPAYGIVEESATGMAAGPLACYLHCKGAKKGGQYLIEQGRYMHQSTPSLLEAHLQTKDGLITSLTVGGNATMRKTLTFSI